MFEKFRSYLRSKAIFLLAWLMSKVIAPISASKVAYSTRGMTTNQIVGLAIGVLLLGVLLPVGLAQWFSYTPTNAIMIVIWPIGAVLIVLGIVLKFYND